MLGNCKPIAGSHAAEPTGWISSCLDRRPLPRCGGGVGGAEPSAASGGCSEAEHPQRSKKSSKRAARRFFRAPQGGGGKYAVATFGAHLCAVRICFSRLLREKQYSYPAQLSVKGVCKGESPVPLCPVLLPFAGAKGTPRRRAVQIMPLQKAPPRRQAPTNSPSILTTNPSYTSPIKPIIYPIITQHFPIL